MAQSFRSQVRDHLFSYVVEKIVEGDKAAEAARKVKIIETLESAYALGIKDEDQLQKEFIRKINEANAKKALEKEALADKLKLEKEKEAATMAMLNKLSQQRIKTETENQINVVNFIILTAGPDANPDDVVNQITKAIPKLKDFKPKIGSLKIYVSTFTNQVFPVITPDPQPQIASTMVSWQQYQAKQLADLGVELYNFLAN